MQRIGVILGSTRQNRFGEQVAHWVMSQLPNTPERQFELLDLRDFNLPFYDEPQSPDTLGGKYSSAIAQRWHDTVAATDAFIFVTPEYNHTYPAVLKNAIDYLYEPWHGKPYSIVCYSPGAIGGARAADQLRNLLNYIGLHSCGEIDLCHAKKQFADGGQPEASIAVRLQTLVNKLTS